MTQKLAHPYIDPEKPWADDILDRQKFGKTLASMIEGITQSFVMSIKGDWGSGKSVFLRRLEAELEGRAPSVPVIFVDAWKYDYYEDPLYALISAVEQRLIKKEERDPKEIGKKLFGAAAKVVAPLAKIAGATADMVTGGAVTTLAEGIGELGEAMQRANKEKQDAHGELRERLKEARDRLLRLDGDIKRRDEERKVVVIIDELDRCRPDYAIRLLERIKHFFDLPGYMFVVAVDGANLHEAVRTLYGSHVDGEKYLRKFFDLETYLPQPDTYSFNKLLRQEFEAFDETTASESNWKGLAREITQQGVLVGGDARKGALVEASAFFEGIAYAFDLKLRDQAQAYSRLHATVMAFGGRPGFLPVSAALIGCLRYFDHSLYESWRVTGIVPKIRDSTGEERSFHRSIMLRAAFTAKAVDDYLALAVFDDEANITNYIDQRHRSGTAVSAVVINRLSRCNGSWASELKRSYQDVFSILQMLEDT